MSSGSWKSLASPGRSSGLQRFLCQPACGRFTRRIRFGHGYSRVLLRSEQIVQLSLLCVTGEGGITRRRPDPAIFFADKIDMRQLFAPAKTPRDAGLFVQVFSERLS